MTSTIPAYIYGPVILTLLCGHALTFKLMLRRIRDLEYALMARRMLLGEPDQQTVTKTGSGTPFKLASGDSICFKFTVPLTEFELMSTNATTITWEAR